MPIPPRRLLATGLFVVLGVGAGAVRVYLQRREAADRERMLRDLAAATARSNREIDERVRRQEAEAMQAELRKSIAETEEMGRRITHPPDAGTAKAAGEEKAPERRSLATEMPGELVVAAADVAMLAVRDSGAHDFRDRAAKREIVSALTAVHDELQTALGGAQQFPDPAPVRATLPRVEQALARVEAVMNEGTWKKMAVRNITDLRNELRDFAPATPDAGR